MRQVKSNITVIVTLVVFVAAVFFVYDLVFSDPEHFEGLIIEKIYVPPKLNTGQTLYGGARRSNYFITAQTVDQWIAVVTIESGDTLTIHCMPAHYHTKNVGDKIHFKKYEGKHFHIQYFAHNEEED
jgi:hypothetical protein